MKSLFSKFALIFAAVLLTAAGLLTAHAETFGDFAYTATSTEVKITRYTGTGGAVTIPSAIASLPVTSIEYAAFSGCASLTSVTIPSSITSIGPYAFSGCTGLTSLTIPSSVMSIRKDAFSGCKGLTSVVIPSSVTYIEYEAFSGCTGLTSVVIPSSLTFIDANVFSGCKGLTSVTIPSSVTSIGYLAFYGCTGLTSVTIPSSVTSIGEAAFSGCTALTSITIPSSITSIEPYALSGCTGLTSLAIPSSVTSIYKMAFSGCKGLTSVTIPSSVTFIEGSAFYDCTGLMSIEVDGSNRFFSSVNGVLFDKDKTKILQYPIGKNGACPIPSSVTSIGNAAFSGCTGLTSVTIPSSITSIGSSAFSGCASLTSVTIPSSVTLIGTAVFSGCTGLTSVVIPSSVTSIWGGAFSGCTGLMDLYFQGDVPSVRDNAFYGAEQAIVHYLSGTSGWASTFCGLKTVTLGITQQPMAASVYLGANVVLSVTSTNSGTVSYQWKKNGADIQGAHGQTLEINHVRAPDLGSYTVSITEGSTVVTSDAAILTATADLRDSDGDGMTNYDEVFVYGTNPDLADSDGDGLSDGYEAGIGRFSIVAGSFTWAQARADAHARGGELACFPTQVLWNQTIASLGATALDDYTGLWIGASDAAVEGTWKWVNGVAFSYSTWASKRPSSVKSNTLDYAEVSGGLGAEIGMWYDRGPNTLRDGYLLEIGYTTDPLVADADGDGLNDAQEQAAGSNPFVADTDGDGLTDGQEVNLTHTNPLKADSNNNDTNDATEDPDGDGLANLEEVNLTHTDPLKADSDDNSTNDADEDSDGDGLSNLAEIRNSHTDHLLADTDGDGLMDGAEVLTHHTNPLLVDTDGDGLSDGEEVLKYQTNPLMADTDGDSYSDGYEVANGSDPTLSSSFPTYTLTLSDDGVTTGGSFIKTGTLAHGSTATLTAVADAGYVFSVWTADLTGSDNPQTLLMDGDKTVGATFDPDTGDDDGDGLTNYEESVIYNTNPNLADTDRDGLSDSVEVQTYGTDPNNSDTSNDGMIDGLAVSMGLDPLGSYPSVIEQIQQVREKLGLYSLQDLSDLRTGSTTVKMLPSAGGVQLRLKVEKSADLSNWQDAGEAVYEEAADPAVPKQLFRFGVE